ncbi:Phosphate-specific transport system accessory protein PhoU homolog [uncultured Pleomorphomonas sp.]|uniref:Phosphate-specific transport system accessory protein PhoU n=2 Tax=Pleomorphomonas TaxID=261933 RepID=A0A2G9WXA0_9HYPH|nr:phosphate signaling complex protein PhoU [Pleomorphomonas carboxyditropha]PIO98932.1 phosphate transport system regulatory protein PhoU [Pleomorphomonas carboxyditropha]SCM77880.1 Phosphate-specific transport system accessory protein PhoU homolog [uncultured Pleomorphomonas sp.]
MEHTVSAYDDDLKAIARMVTEIGGLAERAVGDAVEALTRLDTGLAQRVITGDKELDRLQREIEDKAILVIARRQPMASDLREIVGAMRIANDIERVGDLAKNIAKRVVAINGVFPHKQLITGVEHLCEIALQQLKKVLDAYASQDDQAANAVRLRDDEIDALYTSLFRELLTYMMEDPRNLTFCIHLLFCAKNIERIGDHATNIAESVHYVVTGRSYEDERPKADASIDSTVAGS